MCGLSCLKPQYFVPHEVIVQEEVRNPSNIAGHPYVHCHHQHKYEKGEDR